MQRHVELLKSAILSGCTPSDSTASWLIGTAKKQYLQTTDLHFQKAVQNPVLQMAETGRNGLKVENTAYEKIPVFQGASTGFDGLQKATSCPTRI